MGISVCLALFFNPVTFDFYFWNVGREGLLPLLALNLSFLWMVLLSQVWNNRFMGTGVALYLCALAGFCLNLKEENSLDTFWRIYLYEFASRGRIRDGQNWSVSLQNPLYKMRVER